MPKQVSGAAATIAGAARDDGLARSVRLFRAFRREQTDPDLFYGSLAEDSARQVRRYHDLHGALLLDVGGGPGYFADAFEAAGARYVALDADAGEMALHGRTPGPRTIQGSGMALPVRTGLVDVCYSSNVLEHVSDPWRMADEMVRVTRPGGTVFLSFTLWWGPWGGHETAPWHYLGGEYAARRYAHRHGHEPKNRFGSGLFALTAAAALRWASGCRDAELAAALPRYLPVWAAPVLRVPLMREVVTWNLLLVMRKSDS
ncbi:MAG: class I SAM-dependent methyltransferase [Candidatus Nanopelagicales bacterium]